VSRIGETTQCILSVRCQTIRFGVIRNEFVGSIRPECLNHVIVLGERQLRWTLKRYVRYYLDSRSHLSLEKDSPNSRPVQSVGQIMAIPLVGGLQHRYQRRAA